MLSWVIRGITTFAKAYLCDRLDPVQAPIYRSKPVGLERRKQGAHSVWLPALRQLCNPTEPVWQLAQLLPELADKTLLDNLSIRKLQGATGTFQIIKTDSLI